MTRSKEMLVSFIHESGSFSASRLLGRSISLSFIDIRAFVVRNPVSGGVDFRKPRCPVALVIKVVFPDMPYCVVHQQ
jgi:hypothetical protein